MFLVFNKEKIYAYVVSVVTVCFLFFIASVNNEKYVETSTNIYINDYSSNNTLSMNNIYK